MNPPAVKTLLYARDQAAARRAANMPGMAAEAWAPAGVTWPAQIASARLIEGGATPQAQIWLALAQTLAGGATALLLDLALAPPDEQSLLRARGLLESGDLVLGVLPDSSCALIGLKRAVPEFFTVPEFTAPMLRARARRYGCVLREFRMARGGT